MHAQDRAAKKLLDKVVTTYDRYASIEIDLDMRMTIPEEEDRLAHVSIIQQGDMFLFRHPDQIMYCDGNDLWIYIPAQNEIQINDYDKDEEEGLMISPKDILKHYESGKYAYHLLSEAEHQAEVEFKPIDRNGDYSKYQITINTLKNEIQKIIAYAKDGSRITLSMKGMEVNKKYPKGFFVLDESQYPGVYVEDLRLD